MIQHLLARLDAARLAKRQRELRRQEQDAIARLGATTLAEGGPREGRLSTLATEAATLRRRLDAFSPAKRPGGTKRDPRQETLEAKLHQLHLTAGRLALAMPTAGGAEEVQAIRDDLAEVAAEQARIQADSRRLVEDGWTDLQGWLRPHGPMLGTAVVGWWITRSYVTSNTAAVLTALGRSPKTRGAHWISLTADTAIVHYGLPLAAAAVSAWVGHQVTVRVRASVDEYRAQATARARGRASARADARGQPVAAADRVRSSRDPRAPARTEKVG